MSVAKLQKLQAKDWKSNWPPLISGNMPLCRAMVPLEGPFACIKVILCALRVAPPVPELRVFLGAGLKAQFKEMLKQKSSYDEMPWRHQDAPRWDRYIWMK